MRDRHPVQLHGHEPTLKLLEQPLRPTMSRHRLLGAFPGAGELIVSLLERGRRTIAPALGFLQHPLGALELAAGIRLGAARRLQPLGALASTFPTLLAS